MKGVSGADLAAANFRDGSRAPGQQNHDCSKSLLLFLLIIVVAINIIMTTIHTKKQVE